MLRIREGTNWLEKALALGEQSLNSAPEGRFYRLSDVAEVASDAGEFRKAAEYAQQLLDSAAEFQSDWNYGNAIHNGNLILGSLAIRRGDLEKACEYLLRAGETRGSPQLDTFGPDLSLAEELLEKGCNDAVIQYLDLCSVFWEPGRDRLQAWRLDVEQGRTPKFDR